MQAPDENFNEFADLFLDIGEKYLKVSSVCMEILLYT